MNKNALIKKLIAYGIIITAAAYFMPRQKDWTPYFSSAFNTPFGNEILYDHLDELFPSKKITTNYSSFYQIKDSLLNNKANLIMIQEELGMDSLDLDVLIKFIAKGNNVFISSLTFPNRLLDTLKYDLKTDWSLISTILPNEESQDTIFHDFYNKNLSIDSSYIFTTEFRLSYFETLDSLTRNSGLGWAKDDSLAIFVMDSIGMGRIFLHSNPYCFSNYYMMKDHQRSYIEKALSFLPKENTIWDEYYNPYYQEIESKDILKVIRAKPPLAWALYLALSGLILYLLFMSKRKQRIIPVLDSFPNESLNLIRTIGELYYNTADNKKVATKKINHFYSFLNRNIGLDRTMTLEQKKNLLVNKTTQNQETINQMWRLIENLSAQESISDRQIQALQKYIIKFRREFQN